MLVLLVIFIIAAPMLSHAVKVELPKASSSAEQIKPEIITLTLDANGSVFWNDVKVSELEWLASMIESAKKNPMPELHIRADGALAYRNVAKLMSNAASAGLTKISFVTDPIEN